MSPARSKRQPVPHRHSRSDIVKAVAVGAGIVAATSLLVWLLRPGPAGIPATGGIMNRQPRASWLVFMAIALSAFAAWFILLRGRRTRARAKVLLPVALGVVLVATVAGGIMWPGGLLRHAVAPKPEPPLTTTTTNPGAATTTLAAGSGATGSGPTTPATTTPASPTPTTGSK